MMFLLITLIASTLLFFKERGVGTLVFTLYLVSTISGLVASLIEPVSVMFVAVVFGHVFSKRYPGIHSRLGNLSARGKSRIRSASARTDCYIDRVCERVTEFASLSVVQAVVGATKNYADTIFTTLKIRDVADLVYGLLYNEDPEKDRD